jgi:hypothetical protein
MLKSPVQRRLFYLATICATSFRYFTVFQNQFNSKSIISLQKRQQENATVCDKNGGTDRKQMRDRPPENGWIPEETETMMKEHTEKESTI